jgi:CheY-like chemotaxis protein
MRLSRHGSLSLRTSRSSPQSRRFKRQRPERSRGLRPRPGSRVDAFSSSRTDDDGRELVGAVLESVGATVFSAASSQAAIDLLAHVDPDVLVADIGLPGEDGYALLARVQAHTRAQDRQVPAIALTAYARTSDRDRALRAGFQNHLVKPIDPDDLIRAVSAVL